MLKSRTELNELFTTETQSRRGHREIYKEARNTGEIPYEFITRKPGMQEILFSWTPGLLIIFSLCLCASVVYFPFRGKRFIQNSSL